MIGRRCKFEPCALRRISDRSKGGGFYRIDEGTCATSAETKRFIGSPRRANKICLPKDFHAVLDMSARISSDPDAERTVHDGFAAMMYRIDRDHLPDVRKVLHLSSPILRLITRLNAWSAGGCVRIAAAFLIDALNGKQIRVVINRLPLGGAGMVRVAYGIGWRRTT